MAHEGVPLASSGLAAPARPALPARIFDGLLAGMNGSATVLVMALVALICADVIGRTVFNAPLPGVVEGVRVVIVVMLWLQVAYTLRIGKHMRSGVLLGRFGPGGQRAVLVLNAIAGAALFAIIGWYGWDEFFISWESGEFEGNDLRIPVWPTWLAVALGASLTAVQYIRDGLRIARHGATQTDVEGAEGTE
jgi:TRAP-type C4-dicarboxylate transport system permease small subunit